MAIAPISTFFQNFVRLAGGFKCLDRSDARDLFEDAGMDFDFVNIHPSQFQKNRNKNVQLLYFNGFLIISHFWRQNG